MALKLRIDEDVKAALRARDKQRLGALRLITAAIKQREVDERVVLGDPEIIAVLDKMAKQRRESIDMYRQGGRLDLVDQEAFELELIQSYLPQALTDDELQALIEQAIVETGATSVKDMGKVMGLVRSQAMGRADMAAVSAAIKAKLVG